MIEETELDTWTPIGELFAQIVAGLAPGVLKGVADQLGEETSRSAKSHARGPRTCDD